MKGNASTLTKLENFQENQEFKTMKNKSLNILKFHNTHQIKLMRYERFI